MMMMRRGGLAAATLLVVLMILAEAVVVVVNAQEAPTINLPQFFNDTTRRYRQDVCDRYRMYDRGQVELRGALEGLELHSLIIEGPFFNLDDNGKLDQDNPGMQAVLLDELASRAGFTWRNSYAFTDGLPPGNSDKTYTDLLLWGTEYYDVFVGREISLNEHFVGAYSLNEFFIHACWGDTRHWQRPRCASA